MTNKTLNIFYVASRLRKVPLRIVFTVSRMATMQEVKLKAIELSNKSLQTTLSTGPTESDESTESNIPNIDIIQQFPLKLSHTTAVEHAVGVDKGKIKKILDNR